MAMGRNSAWAGWIVFASTIIIMISFFNILQGTIALFDDERVVATPEEFVLVDMTSWGWTLVISGVLMLAVGAFLLAGKTWARIVAIVVVGLHAVTQVGWLGAYPVWALLMIGLDTVVLFALTARWSEAREGLLAREERIGAIEDPMHGQLPHEMPAPYGPRVT